MTNEVPLTRAEFSRLAREGVITLSPERDGKAILHYLVYTRGWSNVWWMYAPEEDPDGAHLKIGVHFN